MRSLDENLTLAAEDNFNLRCNRRGNLGSVEGANQAFAGQQDLRARRTDCCAFMVLDYLVPAFYGSLMFLFAPNE